MGHRFDELDRLCVNAIRMLAVDAVEKANSGHPGMPLGAAPMAYVLWQRHLRHAPQDPHWPDRDRFVLSGGHGSMLLYALLHLTGYDLPLDQIRRFRQWGSITPGHPEFGLTPGVEATTGPLGQGSSNAVGMAMTEKWLAAYFNRPSHTIVDHMTYALVTDGDLMEGISAETSSLAGHLGLGKLVYLYDSNDVSLDGPTSMAFTEDVAMRYRAYGWNVLMVEDGDHDLEAIDAALEEAKAESTRPSLIVVRTTIGFGSPNKAGSAAAHGAPLGEKETAATKARLGWPLEPSFLVPPEVAERMGAARDRGQESRDHWIQLLAAYDREHPELARQWKLAQSGELPEGWEESLPAFDQGNKIATRAAGGKALNALAQKVPWLIGGDADLGSSTKTSIDGSGSFGEGDGRNIHFGVREHAMAGIANGMAYHGGVRPFISTFFCFSDYMRPSIRLAALSELPVIYVWTHDSVGVGEDGPTHQPVEHLAALRAIPHLTVFRPGDANEAREAWIWAMRHREGPVALVLSRQGLPVLNDVSIAGGVHRGGYVLRESSLGPPKGILLATGSELSVALSAQEKLAGEGIAVRVVSLPSWEVFAAQEQDYRDEVLPPVVEARVSIEAGVRMGWERWVGARGRIVGLDRFGASAPGNILADNLGLTADAVFEAMKAIL